MAANLWWSFSSNARMSCSSSSSREEVYVAAMPLRASKGPAQLLFSTAYSLNFWDLQHFMVILKARRHPSSPLNSPHHHHHHHHQVVYHVYDFQPSDPENIWVAAAALSGRRVGGVILERQLQKLPNRKCWFVGYAKGNATHAVHKFNHNWETHLVLGHHDCRHYTQGLVEYLTGKEAILEHLRGGKGRLLT